MDEYSFSSFSKAMAKAKFQTWGVMRQTQLGGSCCIHAVLSCIQECLRLNSTDFVPSLCIPSLQDPTCCCKSDGNTTVGWTFNEILTYILTHGLALEVDCPFLGDHVPCRRCKPEFKQIIIQPRIQISRFKISKVANAKQLSNLLRNGRPICVSLYVGHSFGNVDTPPHTDEDGLFVDVHMAPSILDGIYGHAILIVDSGKIKNRSFWLAVNSFGPEWGDGGLIKIDQTVTELFDEVAVLYDVTLLPKEAPRRNI